MADALIFTAHPLSALPALAAGPHKVVHFVRHAQGTHNLAVLQLGGVDGGPEDEYKNWKWYDARLTPLGEEQARALRPHMEQQRVEVVLTSPLSRTVQTALLAVPPGPPFVCEDDCRERIGVHPCDKRRSRTELAADFPSLDLSRLAAEEDDKWTEVREPMEALHARAGRFLRVLRARPETFIAVVTHNDFLTMLLFESELRLADPALRRKFGNAECMSLVLTWSSVGVSGDSSKGVSNGVSNGAGANP